MSSGPIVGSIAGVLVFGMLFTLPSLALLFGVLWCLQHLIGRLDGSAQVLWNITVIFSMLGLCVFGEVLGFIVGWGVGTRVASGASLAHALDGSRVLGPPLESPSQDSSANGGLICVASPNRLVVCRRFE